MILNFLDMNLKVSSAHIILDSDQIWNDNEPKIVEM